MVSSAEFRRLALELPGTSEAPHFDRSAFKVARIYATLAADGGSANVKLTRDMQELKCLTAPEVFQPVAGGWGRMGWTVVALAAIGAAELVAVLEAAWRGAALRGRAFAARSGERNSGRGVGAGPSRSAGGGSERTGEAAAKAATDKAATKKPRKAAGTPKIGGSKIRSKASGGNNGTRKAAPLKGGQAKRKSLDDIPAVSAGRIASAPGNSAGHGPGKGGAGQGRADKGGPGPGRADKGRAGKGRAGQGRAGKGGAGNGGAGRGTRGKPGR